MSTIWLPENCSVKKYKATVNGSKAVVDISVEVGDHYDLGHLLRDLEQLQAEQKKARTAPTRTAAKATAPKLLEKPLLQLEHHPEEC